MNGRHPRKLKGKHAERGVTLVELAIALTIFGVLVGASAILFRSAQAPSAANEKADLISLTESTILGYAQAHMIFPSPGDDAGTAAGASGGAVSAGWLGDQLSESRNSTPIWYAIDSRLIGAPLLYNADPYNLSGGIIPTHSTATILDLCYTLQKVIQSPALYIDGVPIAFALQTGLKPAGNAGATALLLHLPGSLDSQQLIAQGQVSHAIGATELSMRMRCPEMLTRAASSARSVAVSGELLAVGQAVLQFRQLELAQAQQDVLSHDLKIALLSATSAALVADEASTEVALYNSLPTGEIGPAQTIGAAELIASIVITRGFLAITLEQIGQLTPSIEAQTSSVDSAQAAVNVAQTYVTQLTSFQSESLALYNQSARGL